MREHKFNLPRKIGMINLWRQRCTAHKEVKSVNPADCALCDAIAKEICADIQECTELRAFRGVRKEAAEIADKN